MPSVTVTLQVPDIARLVQLPRMARVRQTFDVERVADLEGEVARQLQVGGVPGRVWPGMRIALTAGSRGIANIARIIRAAARELERYGARPFVVPAMGSHGGATATGQVELLAGYGITEAYVGVPILSDMEPVQVGELPNGMPVWLDRNVAEADGCIAINRVKPHTDFKGPIESGLAKICAIGLGKQRGAQTIHAHGVHGLRDLMPEAAQVVVQRGKVLLGLAILENAYDETGRIVAAAPEDIGRQPEQGLLLQAKAMMASLPFDFLDVLVVDEMGKNISGVGMDSNVLGRMNVYGSAEFDRPTIVNVVVLDLTPDSHGNASGIGLADYTTARVVNQVSLEATYINAMTASVCGTRRSKIPIILPNDRDAIGAAMLSVGKADLREEGVVRIKNTLHLEEMEVSESLLEAVRQHPRLEQLDDPKPIAFEADGRIAPLALGAATAAA